MSFRSRLKSLFSRKKVSEQQQAEEIVKEIIDEVDETDLQEIWTDIADEMQATATLSLAHDFDSFAHVDNGLELFTLGWVDMGEDSDTVANARNEFFELMEQYDISRDEFDWDSWRDWYEE